jgi:V/A-type H+/Na+-transporting ATPase subunit D
MNGIPPGRAGRLWLQHRLNTAEHAVDLLQRSLRVMRDERERMRLRAARTEEEWRVRCAEAEAFILRAALVGGRRTLLLAAPTERADVAIDHTVTMGVRHPARATCTASREQPRTPDGIALAPARRACQDALEAACAHAAATAALAALDHEITATRQRLRAIERRWLPRLRTALAQTELTLEEQEREDGARLRRATALSLHAPEDRSRCPPPRSRTG